MLKPMSGSKALSSSWPACAAMLMATSRPITSKQTWFTTSGMTGLTLPGMMVEPGCNFAQEIHLPKVARDLDEIDGVRLEDAGDFHKRIGVGRFAHQIFTAGKAQTREFPQFFDDQKNVVAGRGKARADGRTAEIHHAQTLLALERPPAVAADRLGKGGKFGAQRDRYGILQLGAAHFNDGGECLFFFLQGALQRGRLGGETAQTPDGGDPEGRRIDVVGRLMAIHVVQRRNDRVVAFGAA